MKACSLIGVVLWLAIPVRGFQHCGISPVGLLASRTLRNIQHNSPVHAFPLHSSQGSQRRANNAALTETPVMTPNTTEASLAKAMDGNEQASLWRAQAERIREEANKLDVDLTRQKIEAIEKKLNNQVWLLKNPDQLEDLQRQLEILQAKLETGMPGSKKSDGSPRNRVADANFGSSITETIASSPASSSGPSSRHSAAAKKLEKKKSAKKFHVEEENPLCGFDQADLDLYMPVVTAIEERLPSNATMQEKINAFQAAPELQEHFREKINKILVEPMQDMIRLEQLKQDYLESNSSVERANIKREIERLEATMENEGPVFYSDSIVYEGLPALEEEEIQRRMEAVGSLHPILQALYNLNFDLSEF